LKIAINCSELDFERIDGTRVYVSQVVSRLGNIDTEDQFLLYHRKKFNPVLAPVTGANFREIILPDQAGWTYRRFSESLVREKPDVCWLPMHHLPLKRDCTTKFIVTIHDLAYEKFPEHFPLIDRWKLHFFSKHAILGADKIIAISQSTKKDILEFFPEIKEEKIAVIYHGYDQKRFSLSKSKKEILNDLIALGITRDLKVIPKYLLYVGAIQPRKNLQTLIKAFEQLKQLAIFKDWKLVIAGASAWKAEKVLKKIFSSSQRRDIILTGGIKFEYLASLYQGAVVFIYPSLYEGFGLPVVEAFASGIPVIVADNSSLREIGRGAALSFQTNDYQELADKIVQVVTNETEKQRLIVAGRVAAKKFDWDVAARETLNFLKSK
jgi:glycosyltransferase involved in cell wall biosynthesis